MDTVVGPILDFRGFENGMWCTSALVVVKGSGSPQLSWWVDEGAESDAAKSCANRTLLKSFGEHETYRFD